MTYYVSEGDLENYLTIDVNDSFSSQILDWAEAVTNYIDNYTGRSWQNSGSTSSTKYYDGNGQRVLDIDYFTSISSVEILALNNSDVDFTLSEGQDNDFITFPYNTTPKFRLMMTPVSRVGGWLKGQKRIKVTGVFDAISVPKDVRLAATMLLAQIVEKGAKGGNIVSESLGDYSVTFKDIDSNSNFMNVRKLLEPYKVYKL